MCLVGVCNEGRCSSMVIGLSNDGKWVFNKACTMPWCHTVVHFEVKTIRFRARFRKQQQLQQAASRRSKSPCDHTVAQNRLPSSSKRPGSECATPQTSFVAF